MTSLAEHVPVTRQREAALLELSELVVEYGVGPRSARAVDGVDLVIHEGEVLGLAGESGCGKTTIANAVLQILRPPARIAGLEADQAPAEAPLRGMAGAQFVIDRCRHGRRG